MTPQEVKLWLKLRALRQAGFHLRRQVPVDGFIVDFACLKHRLVIEVDGGQHSSEVHAAADGARDARQLQLGYRVQRFWNAEVETNLDGVVETILARLQAIPSLPSGEGGREADGWGEA